MEFDFTPEQIQLRQAVREFAEQEIRPHVRGRDFSAGNDQVTLSRPRSSLQGSGWRQQTCRHRAAGYGAAAQLCRANIR